MNEATFDLGVGVALAHALAARVAVELGARAISIKGPAADHHSLRAARISADADILVDPAGFDAFCSELALRGWRERVARVAPSLLEPHSRTFFHPKWPCDIDVHRAFPGFFASDSDVFDVLWRTREVLRIANYAINVPSKGASGVIAGLHALRNPQDPRHSHEFAELQRRLRGEFGASDRREFVDVATQTRSAWVLRELVAEISKSPVLLDLSADELRAWEINLTYGADGGAVAWWIKFRSSAPHTRKMRTLVDAVWVPRREIPRNDSFTVPTYREMWTYQLVRWRRGTRVLARFLFRRGGTPGR